MNIGNFHGKYTIDTGRRCVHCGRRVAQNRLTGNWTHVGLGRTDTPNCRPRSRFLWSRLSIQTQRFNTVAQPEPDLYYGAW